MCVCPPVHIGMRGTDICMYLCTPLMRMCERVGNDAPDAHTGARVRVRTMRLLHGMCASATLSLRKAKSVEHAHMVLMDTST